MKGFFRKLLVLFLFSQSLLFAEKGSEVVAPTTTPSMFNDSKNSGDSSVPAPKRAKCTVMIYVQADSVLNNFAARNFQAMATVGSNENLNIIVQWNQPKKNGTWRYKINKNQMELLEKGPQTVVTDFSADLIDFAAFSEKHCPADDYVLILWNHGIGIVDPEWSSLQNFAVNPSTLANTGQRINVDGIAENFRGILFDVPNRSYLTNQGLTDALSYITTNVIKKKFALIGMDACLMSMLEVHYQIREFAEVVVSSEEVELAQGWNYAPFLHSLSTTPLSTKDLAKSIVSTFGDFYQSKTKFYTQSAINLETIPLVKENLDDIVNNIIVCKKTNGRCINLAVKKARESCLQLSVSCYIDLYSFYSELQKELNIITNTPKLKAFTDSTQFNDLQASLSRGMELIDLTVFANVASDYLRRARGISIYFPLKTIDPSYYHTSFIQDSLWLPFLQQSMR